MFDRNRTVLLAGVPLADMYFFHCEEDVPYCQKLCNLIVDLGVTEILAGVDLLLPYLKRPYISVHLFHRGWLRSHSSWLEVQQATVERQPLLVGRHNAKVFVVLPAEQGKYHASLGEFWRDWETPYELSVPTLPLMSYYLGVVLKEVRAGTLAPSPR